MKIISNDDSYADALSTAAFATIPFIAIGTLDHPVVLYVAAGLGILFFILFLIRLILIIRGHTEEVRSRLLDNVMSLLQFPYVTALAAMIFIDHDIDVTAALWMSLALAIGTVPAARMFNDLD